MVYNSWVFVFFAVTIYLLYLRLGHVGQNRLLLVSGCFFYGYFDYRFLGLVFISAGLDYVCSHGIAMSQSPTARFRLLVLAIAGNLAILGFFKYCDFFIENVHAICLCVGYQIPLRPLQILLPAGISFYTFQSMSYTIDIYRGEAEACRNPRDFAVSIMFFPHLLAGPIQRAGNLIDQVRNPRYLTSEYIRSGLWLLLKGYFAKVVVADNVGVIADRIFSLDQPTGGSALLGVYAFALEIYCDFAGYSNIARGLAKMMGFDLMLNFRQPYFATNPSDFWRRWHISLSTWLRDYLYIPLGGNRGSNLRISVNLMITMLLGGLWHGAAWKFVFWGFYHGALLIGFRLLSNAKSEPPSSWRCLQPLKIVGFLHLTCFGWLIFRCDSLAQIISFPRAIFTNFSWTVENHQTLCVLAFLALPIFVLDLLNEFAEAPGICFARLPALATAILAKSRLVFGSAGICAMFFLLWFLGSRAGKPFIYFQF